MSRQANADARAILYGLLLEGLLFLPLFWGLRPAWYLLVIYALPVPFVVMLAAALRLWRRKVRSAVSRTLLLAGVLAAAGGVTFDGLATVAHSPDLRQEANPVARLLLDTGHDLPFVYFYCTLTQVQIAGIMCAVWAAFLAHRADYLESAYARGRESFLRFLGAALGGRDLPRAYCLLWLAVPLFILGGALQRWYLGMEWFDGTPRYPHNTLLAGLAAASLAGTLLWLGVEYRRRRAAGADGTVRRTGCQPVPVRFKA
jgi:hypothetical protein